MRLTLLTAATICFAAPVFADDTPPEAQHDSYTIGIGVLSSPRFEGSNKSSIGPGAGGRATISGYNISISGPTLRVDLIREKPDNQKGKFILGPIVHIGADRSSLSSIKDTQVAALGVRKVSVSAGGQIGYRWNGLITSAYDNLSITVTGAQEVSNTYNSYIITPSISYLTPLSKKIAVSVGASADYEGAGYARSFFGVTPTQAAASGLPVYSTGSGWEDLTENGFVAYSLGHDLRKGLMLLAGVNHEQILGGFARSPIVRDRQQWGGGVGLSYTF